MNTPGKDSPDQQIVVPGVLVSTCPHGHQSATLGFLVGTMSTVNESMRTTVGWSRSYADGYERIFDRQETSVN